MSCFIIYVESVETNGMWIGIDDNIDQYLDDRELTLDKGAIMFLHADGITEAIKPSNSEDARSQKCEMFGDDNLIDIFKNSAERTIDEIKNIIINSLKSYEVIDDVTIVLIKRI